MNAMLANQAAIAGASFTPIQVPMDPADGAPDLAAINQAITQQVAVANSNIAALARPGMPVTPVVPQPITLPDDLPADTTAPAAAEAQSASDPDAPAEPIAPGAATSGAMTPNAADQSRAGVAEDATYGVAEQVASGMGGAAQEAATPSMAADNATAGVAEHATYGTAEQAAYQGAGTSSADAAPLAAAQPADGDTGFRAGEAQSTSGFQAGDGGSDAGFRTGDGEGARAGSGNTGFVEPQEGTQVGDDAASSVLSRLGQGNPTSIEDPFETHVTQGQSNEPDSSGLKPMTDEQLNPPPGAEPDPSLTGGAGSSVGGLSPAEVLLEMAAKTTTVGNPLAQVTDLYRTELEVIKETSLPQQEHETPDGPPGEGAAAGPVDLSLAQLPDLPDVPDVPSVPGVPDVLGNVDSTNTVQAPDGATEGIELPTIPDIPTDAPAPPPPPDMPALDLPDIPAVPDVPAIPEMPAIPELPDPPALPDAPDFAADDGPSFGDDIGSDVTPNDPTTTDF